MIPINSPAHYPQYNGGIEAAQRQIKEALARHPGSPISLLDIQAQVDVDAINHRKRRCLNNRSPCRIFSEAQGQAREFTRRKRREIYDQIRTNALKLRDQHEDDPEAAWRLAVEKWLLDNGFITLSNRPKV